MDQTYRVIAAWTASYPDRVRAAAGEAVRLTGRRDLWEGHLWLWAVDTMGREGWVPETLFEITGDRAVARTGYAAVELSCAEGTVLTGTRAVQGWIWCRTEDGPEGWVPQRCLRAGED